MSSLNLSDRLEPREFQGRIDYDMGKNGIVSFAGHVYLKDLEVDTITNAVGQLFTMHKAIEGVFRINGYKVASDIHKLPTPDKNSSKSE